MKNYKFYPNGGRGLYDAYRDEHKVLFCFVKADGSDRKLVAVRDPIAQKMEESIAGKRQNSDPNVVRVVELTEAGAHQWRSIKLDSVYDGAILD